MITNIGKRIRVDSGNFDFERDADTSVDEEVERRR